MVQNEREDGYRRRDHDRSQTEDREVRDMFWLAGIRIEDEEDVTRFARLWRLMCDREEARQKRILSWAKMQIFLLSAVTSIVLGVAIPAILKWAKLI